MRAEITGEIIMIKLTELLENTADSSKLNITRGYETIFQGWKGLLNDPEKRRKLEIERLKVVNMVTSKRSGMGELLIFTQEMEPNETI